MAAGHRNLLSIWELLKQIRSYDIIQPGKPEPGGLPSFIGGANPPDERKEGDADVCYIFGFDPDRYIHLCPCWIVLYNFQGNTKIAAITANNDG